MEFTDVMQRASQVVEKKLGMKPTDAIIAKYLDISSTNFANMKKRNRIPYKEINYFSAKYNVSANWILFNQHCETLVSEEEKFYSLKVIDRINASCGGGSIDDELIETRTIKVNKEQLEQLGFSSGNNLEAIKVVGDSMLPTLKESDLVLINRKSNKYNNKDAFLVNTTHGLFIKRLQIDSDESKIDLISDNETYANITFNLDEVTIMGKVVGILESNEAEKDAPNEINQINNNEKIEDTKEVKIKINFYTDYVKLVNDEYEIFTPETSMQNGYDCDTDEPLYDLENNQFYAIIIRCDDYDTLHNNRKLDIEHHGCVTVSEKEYNNYMFLFNDFFSFQHERSQLYRLVEED